MNDSRLLEECQTQIQDNEDVQEHLRQPVIVEQIEPEKKQTLQQRQQQNKATFGHDSDTSVSHRTA